MSRQLKLLRDLVRDNCDALRVRILVALELIGRLRELYKSLSRRAIDQLCLNCRHITSSLFSHKKAQKSQNENCPECFKPRNTRSFTSLRLLRLNLLCLLWLIILMRGVAHGPCGCLDPRRRRAPLRLSRAASNRDRDTTPRASFDIQRCSDRVLPQRLILLRRRASCLRLPRAPDHKTRGNVARWEQLSQPTQITRARLSFAPSRAPQILV